MSAGPIDLVLVPGGSERAALLGLAEGAAMCSLFAATDPARTGALVLHALKGVPGEWRLFAAFHPGRR